MGPTPDAMALRTGLPQNDLKDKNDFFDVLYADPAKTAQFARAMSGSALMRRGQLRRGFPGSSTTA